MTTLRVPLDAKTEQDLNQISGAEGVSATDMAARLLRRAVRARRPRPQWDVESLRTAAVEFAAEDAALADSDWQHRAALLAAEDAAA